MATAQPHSSGLDRIETASRDEIAGLQLERMKWSIRHAYENSPFYRKQFENHGVHPDDLKTLTDLAKFPFTVKQDLRDNYPFGIFAVPREKLSRIHGSSGTTGTPSTWATSGSATRTSPTSGTRSNAIPRAPSGS